MAVLFCLLTSAAHAQIRVELNLPRRLYMVHEPVLATVTITNLTGQDILLHDDGPRKWFAFDIVTLDGRPIPPTDPNVAVEALQIASGQSVRRQINMTPIYRIAEFGTYKVSATVWFADTNRLYSSVPAQFEITEGRAIWREVVGAPGGGTREFTLLNFRRDRDNRLYVRVQDRENGIVYATMHLGRSLTFATPETMLDASNTLHIIQMTEPRRFLYTQVDPNGQVLARETYEGNPAGNPRLRRTSSGAVSVVGGAVALNANETPGGPPAGVPKLSDRPATLSTASPPDASPSGDSDAPR